MNKKQRDWLKASVILMFILSIIAIYILGTFQIPSEIKLFDINKKYIKKTIMTPRGESFSLIIVGEHKHMLSGNIRIKDNDKIIYQRIFNTNNLPKGEFVYKLEKYKYNNYELPIINTLEKNKVYMIELQLEKKPSGTFSLWLNGLFNYIQI